MSARGGRLGAAAAILLAACGTAAEPGPPSDNSSITALANRLDEIDRAVGEWRSADSIGAAHRAAERAANLIVGPNGPDYGDRNGDGAIDGDTTVGLLQGLDGTPVGIADSLRSNQCVVKDVLGGEWDDPANRWQIMLDAIDAWEPGNNTMPALPSHPMRVVGWATFTLASESLQDAHGYAGHARLHVDISSRALEC